MYIVSDFDRIKKYKIGTPVVYNIRDTLRSGDGKTYKANMFGHIIGFSINSTDELLIQVKWADGSENPIHPSNVIILQD